MPSRERKSYPCSGVFFHREHRSKKRRKIIDLKENSGSIRKKRLLEKLKVKDLEDERI